MGLGLFKVPPPQEFPQAGSVFLISFPPYYALNGISVHPENKLPSLRHLIRLSITLKPAPLIHIYFGARGFVALRKIAASIQ